MELGIDIGTNMGLAWITDDGALHYDCTNLKPGKTEDGERYINCLLALQAMQQPSIIYYEQVRRHMGTQAAHVYGGLLAVIKMYAFKRSVPMHGIGVGIIKKHATGKGNAKKDKMIEAAKEEFGYDGNDDNEADALWILSAGRCGK